MLGEKLFDLIKRYRCSNIEEIIYELIRKIIFSFKILIWERRNSTQIAEEKRRDISTRNKKKFVKIDNIIRNDHSKKKLKLELYEVWNGYAFQFGGKWLDF